MKEVFLKLKQSKKKPNQNKKKTMNEYPKAITALIVAVLMVVIRKFFPEFVTSDLEVQIYTVVLGAVIFFAGRYFRMSKTDAETLDKLKNPY